MISGWTWTKICAAASNASKLGIATLMEGLGDHHQHCSDLLLLTQSDLSPACAEGWAGSNSSRGVVKGGMWSSIIQWNQCHCVTWESGWRPLKSAQEKPIPSAGQAGGDRGQCRATLGMENAPWVLISPLAAWVCPCAAPWALLTYMSTDQTGAA